MNSEYRSFLENGFYILKNLYDPSELITDVPTERGKYDYYGDIKTFSYQELI